MGACKLLIVEDELLVATDIERHLSRAGHEIVGVAEDYDRALMLAETKRPDLVLMDIKLRGRRSGIDAALAIREQLQIPVIFLTANADEHTLGKARAAGPYGFLSKPFRKEELREAVAIAIDQHKRAESLFASYQWITTMMNSLSEAVIATDTDAVVRYLNPAAESLTGWTPQDAIGRPITEVYPLTDVAGTAIHECLLKKALATGRYFGKSRLFLTTRSGSRVPIEDSATPILESGQVSGAVTIFLDISERLENERRNEAEHDRLEEEAYAANEALGQTRSELRALAANLMSTQEDERRRIARELHDDLGQQIAYLGMLVERVANETGESLTTQELRLRASQVASTVREVSHRLHPNIIADLGLSIALSSLVTQERAAGHNASFAERNVPSDIPLSTSTALYRIAQEGLRNAAKHAPGAAVQITLSRERRELQLRINDNGLGFSRVQARSNGGLGLLSMQERARLAGGNLLLSTRPGEGTILLVRVPLGD